jgi:hypothetical protein
MTGNKLCKQRNKTNKEREREKERERKKGKVIVDPYTISFVDP